MDVKTLRMRRREGGDDSIGLMRDDKSFEELYFLELVYVFLGNCKVWIMQELVNDHCKQLWCHIGRQGALHVPRGSRCAA